MVNELVFTELEKILKNNNAEILYNNYSKTLFQFIYGNKKYEINRITGEISPYILDRYSKDLDEYDIKDWDKINEFIEKALKKLNVDIHYKYMDENEVECLTENDTHIYFIMQYKKTLFCYKQNGILGVSYHIFTGEFENENVLYNIKDAFSCFLNRTGLFKVTELRNENDFSLSELSSVLYSLHKSKTLLSKEQDMNIRSFTKKTTKLIKLRGGS